MPRYKDEPPAVRVYTVCDESKYLIVRNVPALGCGAELQTLFVKYGDVEECKPMDAEECESFTDIYWIKFQQINSARIAKRKLDESVFLGNRLQVTYAPQYESLSDTKEKLDGRKNEVLARLRSERSRGSEEFYQRAASNTSSMGSSSNAGCQRVDLKQSWDHKKSNHDACVNQSSIMRVSSDQDYFPSQSMNETVRKVRDKLNKIESSASHVQGGPELKNTRGDLPLKKRIWRKENNIQIGKMVAEAVLWG